MAKTYYPMSLEATKFLCGLIRDLASVSEGIDNLHLADDKTFSNIYIKNLVDKCLEDANTEAQKLVGALTHLTCEETAVQPTLDNSEINVIYLYSADGNPPYQQFLKISDTKLVDLGSTSISLTDYIKAADVAKDYATKTELKAVTDKIGTTTLTTTAQTLTGSIEEVKGIAEQGAMLTVTKEQYEQLVAGQTVNIDGKDYTYDDNTYYVVKNDGDTIVTTSTISSSSTDSEVATAKAVRLNIIGDKPSSEMVANAGNSVLKFPLGNWQIYSSNFAKSLNDLPVQTGGRLEVLSNGLGLTTPWDTSYSIRMYRYSTYTKGEYIRYLYSGDTPGVMAYDSGWQRVVTTKVADVPLTAITWESTSIISSGAANYEVRNGICYVYFRGNPIVQSEHANGRVLASGLPKPTTPGFYMTGIWDLSTSVLLQVNTEGKLLIWSDYINNGKNIHFSFSYPVAES